MQQSSASDSERLSGEPGMAGKAADGAKPRFAASSGPGAISTFTIR